MENINLSTTTDRHIVTIVVTNPTLPLTYHRQITFYRRRQSSASTINIDRPPPLDLATSCYFSIGINPIGNSFDNQSPLFYLPNYISLTPKYASKDTCLKRFLQCKSSGDRSAPYFHDRKGSEYPCLLFTSSATEGRLTYMRKHHLTFAKK